MDLPKLQSIDVGAKSFVFVASFSARSECCRLSFTVDLSQLQAIRFGSGILQMCPDVVFESGCCEPSSF